MNPRVLLLDNPIDIYDLGYIQDINSIQEMRSFKNDKIIENEINLSVKNFDDFFTESNSRSPLNGIDWYFQSFKIYDSNEVLIWDGVIKDIELDHESKIANIRSASKLSEFMNQIIEYKSTGYETAASAAQNLLIAYGFTDYNAASFSASNNYLISKSCYIKCFISKQAGLTLMNALEKLSEYGCADCFMATNILKKELYFLAWQEYNSQKLIDFIPENMLTSPRVVNLIDDMTNDYEISYMNYNGTVVKDSTAGNIGSLSRAKFGTKTLPRIDGDQSQMIIIKDTTSARFIGEQNIKRSTVTLSTIPRPRKKISFSIFLSGTAWLLLGKPSYIGITFPDQAWVNKVFEVYSITRNENNNTIDIEAIECEVT